MVMLRAQKIERAKEYLERVQGAKNAVILQHHGIPVNAINKVRMSVSEEGGEIEVVKKRVFLKGIEGTYDGLTIEQIPGAVFVLYSHNEDDQHAPLKVISKIKKAWKKEKIDTQSIDYVGGWYDGQWHDADYVGELANLPSKEELIGKFLFLLNHPMSSFARVLNAIAEKDGEAPKVAEAPKAEEVAETPKAEETSEQQTEEEQQSEENQE